MKLITNGCKLLSNSEFKITNISSLKGHSIIEYAKDKQAVSDFLTNQEACYVGYFTFNGEEELIQMFYGGESNKHIKFYSILILPNTYQKMNKMLLCLPFMQTTEIFHIFYFYTNDTFYIYDANDRYIKEYTSEDLIKNNALNSNNHDLKSIKECYQAIKARILSKANIAIQSDSFSPSKKMSYYNIAFFESPEGDDRLEGSISLLPDAVFKDRVRMQNMLTYDYLTKIYNREHLTSFITNDIEKKKQGTLVLCDLDHFKYYNDTYGHHMGDVLLKTVSKTIKEFCAGINGEVGRFGGDEFLIYFPGLISKEETREILMKLSQKIGSLKIENYNQIIISLSIGSVSFPEEGEDFDELFNKADFCLYRAKSKGGHAFVIYTPSLHEKKYNSLDGKVRSVEKSTNYRYTELINRAICKYNRTSNIEEVNEEVVNYIISYCGIDSISAVIKIDQSKTVTLQANYSLNYKADQITYEEIYSFLSDFNNSGNYCGYEIDKTEDAFGKFLYGKIHTKNCFVRKVEMTSQNCYGFFVFASNKNNIISDSEIQNVFNVISTLVSYSNYNFYSRNTSYTKEEIDVSTNLPNLFGAVKRFTLFEDKDQTNYTLFSIKFKPEDPNDICFKNNHYLVLSNISKQIVGMLKGHIHSYYLGNDTFGFIYHKKDGVDDIKEFYNYFVKRFSHFNQEDICVSLIYSLGIYKFEPDETIKEGLEKAVSATNFVSLYSFDNVFIYKNKKKDNEELIDFVNDSFYSALKLGEIETYFQPCFDITGKRLVSAECLSRWKHDGKNIPPDLFIPVLEKNGKIIDLDFHVLDYVLSEMRKWIDEGNSIIPVSINFSKIHFYTQNFVERLVQTIDSYGIPHEYIHIEITESMIIDESIVLKKLTALKENGFKLYLDDFGTGYSNMKLLAIHTFDIIKIDKQFILDVKDKKSEIVLDTIIQLSKSLGSKVLLEGVENQNQLDLVSKKSIDYIQGYFFSKPIAIADFKKKILQYTDEFN